VLIFVRVVEMRHGADTLVDNYERDVFLPDEREVQPNTCEYQKHWETICREQSTTDPMVSKKYESYSCMLCFCRYPQRECEVKKE
jgi:hypothetical protein